MDDLKVSLRQLLKTPGFSAAAIAVLALSIGLNAAMFSVVHALAFAARPFPQPERLVQLYSRQGQPAGYRAFSYAVYEDLAGRTDLFDGVLAHNTAIVGSGEGAESRRTFSVIVSANYFDVLGVPMLQGRGFTIDESRPGSDVPVVAATYAYWKRTGFDPQLVGRTIRVNEREFTVVGITPPGFTGTMTVFGPELFFPLGVFSSLATVLQGESTRQLHRSDTYELFLVGRLKPGVAATAVTEALGLYGQSLARSFPAEYEDHVLSSGPLPRFGTSTSPTNETVVTTLGAVLLAMTGAVLLTVCLNLASMMLARGRGRSKEFAIRLALGGSQARIIRQLLVEGLLLSLIGGGLGVALGLVGIDRVITTISTIVPVTIVLEGTVSPALVAATLLLCLIATLTIALGPALKHSRPDILSGLKVQTGDDPAPRRWPLLPRNPLVAAQVALSLSLLIAAGLFLRMALGASLADLGYRADETVMAEVDSRLGGMDEARSLDLYARVEQRLAGIPGVQTASIGALAPMGLISISKEVRRAGIRPLGSEPATPQAGRAYRSPWNAVGANYFDTMGIRLVRGRPFTSAETFARGAPLVAIVDETLAQRLWPDGDALGQQIQWADDDSETSAPSPMQIVGVVTNTQRELFENVPRGAIYVPFAQGFTANVYFHVRPFATAPALIDSVRRELREAAPSLPLFAVRTFAAHLDSSAEYWALRMTSSMFALFGTLAMVVALVGIYSVTAYMVARRTREIGVRMAIGARPREILDLIMRETLTTVLAGIALGWLFGLGVGRMMASLFVDLDAFDAWTFALVPAGFVIAALVATWLPARRATAVNPVTALRSE